MSSNEDYGHFLAELNSAKFQALRPARREYSASIWTNSRALPM